MHYPLIKPGLLDAHTFKDMLKSNLSGLQLNPTRTYLGEQNYM
jgi:hypothetical protein